VVILYKKGKKLYMGIDLILLLIYQQFPDRPIRHGNKYWTWLHWYLDVEITHLLRAKSVTVRCHNVFKNTQPERPSWNIMGYVLISFF
jgi:nitrate reductase (NAD(P)H)